jgi:hypothetical protein
VLRNARATMNDWADSGERADASSQAPANVTHAIISFIRPACQHADPDVCPLPTTKHPAQAIGAAPEPVVTAARPHPEPLPPGAR